MIKKEGVRLKGEENKINLRDYIKIGSSVTLGDDVNMRCGGVVCLICFAVIK